MCPEGYFADSTNADAEQTNPQIPDSRHQLPFNGKTLHGSKGGRQSWCSIYISLSSRWHYSHFWSPFKVIDLIVNENCWFVRRKEACKLSGVIRALSGLSVFIDRRYKASLDCSKHKLSQIYVFGPRFLYLRNKSYWIHEGPSKSVHVCHAADKNITNIQVKSIACRNIKTTAQISQQPHPLLRKHLSDRAN